MPVDRPYAVAVPRPYPVAVERHVAVPVDRPVPVPVPHAVPYPVIKQVWQNIMIMQMSTENALTELLIDLQLPESSFVF